MTASASPGDTPPVYYAEDRSAINGPLVFHTVFWPLLVIACMAAAVSVQSFVFAIPAFVALVIWYKSSITLFGLFVCRPVGIRIDAAGIRIGGLQRAARLASRSKKSWTSAPVQQRREVFFCPWDAVQNVTVVTDKKELKKLRRENQDFGSGKVNEVVALGRLWSPLMRAALVINLDPDQAHFPRVLERGEELHKKTGTYTNKRGSFRSPVWLAPTRHPEKLRDVLSSLPASGPAPPRPGSTGYPSRFTSGETGW